MKAFSIRYGFLTFLVFWCVLKKVRCVPLNFNLSLPSDDFYGKQTYPIDFEREYNYVTEDILSNIENHYNESEIGIHSSEDTTDFNNEFKNQSLSQNEVSKNDTKTISYHLANNKLNQTQNTNDTNYLMHSNDTFQTKQSLIHKQGKTKDTRDFYEDKERYKNASLKTSDARFETSEIDKALQKKELLVNMTSTGDLKYEARNSSDTENKEISSHFAESGHHFKNDIAKQEKKFQGANFTRNRTINQTNDKRTNSEKEQFTKSGSKDYIKEEASGLETLQKKCLNYLRQENQYKDQDKEIRTMKKRKNKKRTFFKRVTDVGLQTIWPNWESFHEDCKDLLQKEINIQNPSFEEKYPKDDTVLIPEIDNSLNNDIGIANSIADDIQSPLTTPTVSSYANESQTQNPGNKETTVETDLIETTTTKKPLVDSPPKESEKSLPAKVAVAYAVTGLSETPPDLSAIQNKFNQIQRYLSVDKDCDDRKYGFSERLQPINSNNTKSNFTYFSRRAQPNPEVIFQDNNITNQAIECIEGEVNCTQDYYEYYYAEENAYGDDYYSETELSDELETPSGTSRQNNAINTMKKTSSQKRHSPLAKSKINSVLNGNEKFRQAIPDENPDTNYG